MLPVPMPMWRPHKPAAVTRRVGTGVAGEEPRLAGLTALGGRCGNLEGKEDDQDDRDSSGKKGRSGRLSLTF